MSDPTSRPAIAAKRDNMDEYDIIFVGFPIWWYVAPTIINTFLESYNLKGKSIIPFATSGGSGMGRTNEMHKSARVCHLHGLFPPSRRRFSATLSGLLATQTIFLNNERGTIKNAVTTFKEVHRNDGLQENSYASKYGDAANAKWNAIRSHPAKPVRQYLKLRIGSGFAGLSMMTLSGLDF